MEPVSDGRADTGEQPSEDVLNWQAGRHVWRVDWRGRNRSRNTAVRTGDGLVTLGAVLVSMGAALLTLGPALVILGLLRYLLGVNANLC